MAGHATAVVYEPRHQAVEHERDAGEEARGPGPHGVVEDLGWHEGVAEHPRCPWSRERLRLARLPERVGRRAALGMVQTCQSVGDGCPIACD